MGCLQADNDQPKRGKFRVLVEGEGEEGSSFTAPALTLLLQPLISRSRRTIRCILPTPAPLALRSRLRPPKRKSLVIQMRF